MDKVQKILSEITTRKLCTMDEHMAFYNDKAKEDYRFLSEIEEFIKASQEEPVSADMWEASKQYALRQVLASTDTKMSEQAYLDLRLFSGLELAVAHKDGAQWQKEQFEKNRLAACDRQTDEEAEIEQSFVMGIIEREHRQPTFDDAIKYGMRLQKEQMIAKAIDAKLLEGHLIRQKGVTHPLHVGDKVKVIVIKED